MAALISEYQLGNLWRFIMQKYLFVFFTALILIGAGNNAAAAPINVISVDCTPFVSPGIGSFGPFNTMGMALLAVDQGGDFTVTEVTPAAFRAMPAAVLSGFDLIAINNHPTRIDCGSGLGLGTNWHSVVGVLSGGRVVLTSHDAPRFKLLRTPPAPPLFTGFEPFGTIDLVRQSALWAGGQPGTTGLLIFNDAARFFTVGGVGWGNPELNLPLAWGITDSDQSGGGFMGGGYTDILAGFQTHPIYDGTAFGGVVLSDARFAPFSISSFSANIVDASFHSIFASFNALIFMPTEVVINAGVPDPGGFGIPGSVAPGPDGTAITVIRNAVLTVVIDIKPGSDPNGVNPRARGSIPVAILTTSTAAGEALDFDATTVDDQTLAFGPNGAAIRHAAGHVEDVDGDGDLDLLVHFKTAETGIACGDTDATLAGQTFGGLLIMGTDFIKTAGC
jgi:hypothetical protein